MKNILCLLKYWWLLAAILFTLLCVNFVSNYLELKRENARKSENIEVLNKNYISYKRAYKNRDTLSAAKVEALAYTIGEYIRFQEKDAQTIKELGLKLKNVQSITNVGTQTSTVIKTKIQYVDSLKCLDYKDKFTSVSGCFNGDSIELKVSTVDSLTVVASRIPKHRFLWWRWGVKGIQLDITAQNPNAQFTFLKYIELK